MNWIKHHFSFIVAVYIVLTGLFFLLNAIMGSDIVGNEMRAKILISGIGALFTFIGTLYVYLIIKGRHNELGGTNHCRGT